MIVALLFGPARPGGVRPASGEPTERRVSRRARRDASRREVPALLAGVRADRGVAMVAERLAGGRRRADRGGPGPRRRRAGHGRAHAAARGSDARRCGCPSRGDGGLGGRARRALRGRARRRAGRRGGQAGRAGGAPRRRAREGTLVGGSAGPLPGPGRPGAAGVCAPDRPGIVHRLDKGTSGLLAVARTADAYAAWSASWPTRTMERRYLALVAATSPTTGARSRRRSGARPARRPRWRSPPAGSRPAPPTPCSSSARRRRPTPTTLLELALQSGRTHQIRVHMAAIGHPVVGDARYGTPDRRLGSGRFFLHAFRLAFTTRDRARAWSSPRRLPEDLQALPLPE